MSRLKMSTVAAGVMLIASSLSAGQYWCTDMARTLMTRHPDPVKYPTGVWSYPQGFMLEGFLKMRAYAGDADSAYYKYVMKYANDRVSASGQISNFRTTWLDDMMPGAILAWAYTNTGNAKFKTAAATILNTIKQFPTTSDGAFFHCKTCTGELWVDGVFMADMFLLRYAKAMGDSDYCYNTVAKHMLLAFKHLQKGGTGLLYHGWDEDKNAPWASRSTGLSPEVWGEGMGWYAMAIVEALEAFPLGHPKRDSLLQTFHTIAAGLKNVQDTSGCWWNVVDKGGQSRNFTDASGSAMFLYSLQKGIDLGLLDKRVYGPVTAKGWSGLKRKARLNAQTLVDVYDACDGVGVQTGYDAYVNFPKKVNAKEATAAFFWASAIMEKPALPTPVARPAHRLLPPARTAHSESVWYDLQGRLSGVQNGSVWIKGSRNVGLTRSNRGGFRVVIAR